MTALELHEFAHSQNVGCTLVAATGNEAMVGSAHVLDYLVDHAETKAIAIFIEGLREEALFAAAADRALRGGKPVVMYKVGKSERAAAVARAHTGADVGSDEAIDAFCAGHAIMRAHSAEDLITTAALAAATGPLKAPGLAFLGPSGGACTIVADAAETHGVSLPQFPPETAERLRALLPSFASTINPLDVTGALLTQPDLLEKVVPLVAASDEVGLLAINLVVPTADNQGYPPALTPLSRALASLDKPAVIVSTASKTINDYTRRVIAEHRLPHIVTGVDAMVRAVRRIAWWSRCKRALVS